MNLLKQNGGILKDMNVHLLKEIENGGVQQWKKFINSINQLNIIKRMV